MVGYAFLLISFKHSANTHSCKQLWGYVLESNRQKGVLTQHKPMDAFRTGLECTLTLPRAAGLMSKLAPPLR